MLNDKKKKIVISTKLELGCCCVDQTTENKTGKTRREHTYGRKGME